MPKTFDIEFGIEININMLILLYGSKLFGFHLKSTII